MARQTTNKKKPSLIRRVVNSLTPHDRGLSWETAAKVCTAAGLFLVPVVVVPWSADPWELQKLGLLFLLVGAAWILLVVAILRRGHDRWTWHPLDIVVLLFGLAVTVSAALSVQWWTSLFGIPGWTSHSLLATWVFIGLYFLVARLFSAPADRRFVWILLLVSLGASLVVQMFQLSDLSLLPEPLNANRWFSTIGNLNIHAVIIAAIFSGGMLLLWSSKAERWQRMVLSFGLALGWLLLLVSGRSLGWAAFAIGMVAVVLHQSRDQRQMNFKVVTAAIVIAAAGLLAQMTNVASYTGLPSYRELTLDQSTTASTTWTTLQHRFVLGTGPATWYNAFVQYRPTSFNQTPVWDIRFAQGSAGWLQLLATTGVAGAALLAGVLILGLIMAWRGWRATGEAYLLLSVVVIVVTLVSGLLTIWSFPLLMLTWASLGLARSTVTDWGRVKTAPMPGWGYGAAAAAVLAGIVMLWPFGAAYASNAWTYHALRLAERGAPLEQVVATLERAHRLDHRNGEASKYLMNAYSQQVQNFVTDKKLDAATAALNKITTIADEAKRLDRNNPQIYETENQILNSLSYAISDAATRAQANFARLREIEPVSPIHDVGYGQTLMAALSSSTQSKLTDAQRATIIQTAIAAYRQALQKKPDYFQARLSLMQALVDQGHPTEALSTFGNVSTYSAVEQAYVALVRGQAYDALKQPLDAAAAVVTGIDAYPSDPSLFVTAADYYKQGGKTDEAKKILERGQKIFPNDSTIADKLKSL